MITGVASATDGRCLVLFGGNVPAMWIPDRPWPPPNTVLVAGPFAPWADTSEAEVFGG